MPDRGAITRDALVDLAAIVGEVIVAMTALQASVNRIGSALAAKEGLEQGDWREELDRAGERVDESKTQVREAFGKLVTLLNQLGTPDA